MVTVSSLHFSALISEQGRAVLWEHGGKPGVNAQDPQTAPRSQGITPVPQAGDEPARQVLCAACQRGRAGAAHHKQSHQPPSVAVPCSTPSALATCLAAHYSLLTNCCSTPCSEPTCRHGRILHMQCKTKKKEKKLFLPPRFRWEAQRSERFIPAALRGRGPSSGPKAHFVLARC